MSFKPEESSWFFGTVQFFSKRKITPQADRFNEICGIIADVARRLCSVQRIDKQPILCQKDPWLILVLVFRIKFFVLLTFENKSQWSGLFHITWFFFIVLLYTKLKLLCKLWRMRWLYVAKTVLDGLVLVHPTFISPYIHFTPRSFDATFNISNASQINDYCHIVFILPLEEKSVLNLFTN